MIKKEPKFRLSELVDFDDKCWFIKEIIIENIISKRFSPASLPFCVPDEFNNQHETKQIYYILEDTIYSKQYKVMESDLEKGFSGNFRSIEEKKTAEFKDGIEEKIKDLKAQVNSKLGMIFWCFVPLYIATIYILGQIFCK